MHSQIIPSREGFRLAGIVIAKRAADHSVPLNTALMHKLLEAAYGKAIEAHVLRHLARAGELMRDVSDIELDYALTPRHLRPSHTVSAQEVNAVAKVMLHLALTGLNEITDVALVSERLAKLQQEDAVNALRKDDDDEEDDDSEDDENDSGDPLLGGGDDMSGDDENTGSSDADFDAKHPRWPAGDPESRGGEFRPKEGEFGGYDANSSIDNQFTQAFLATSKPTSVTSPYVPEYDSAGNPLEGAEPSYPLESLLTFVGVGEVLNALRGASLVADTTSPATHTAIEDAANSVREYLGNDAKMIVNDNGDLVLMNDTQKVRFNIKNPHGYEPHFHVERLDEYGDWVDAGSQHMYFFKE